LKPCSSEFPSNKTFLNVPMKRPVFETITLKTPHIIVGSLVIATVISGYYYYLGEASSKLTALLGGLLSGILLVIVQFLFSWYEYRTSAEYAALGIKKVLLHRDDRAFYENLIRNASSRVWVLGVTAHRFMEHFADSATDRSEARVILDAMQTRNVSVKILIPDQRFLTGKDRTRFNETKRLFDEIKGKHQQFENRYFDHIPSHSLVVIDDECIIGPVFPDVSSKDTPAIYMGTSNKYAQKYLEYFEKEWKMAKA